MPQPNTENIAWMIDSAWLPRLELAMAGTPMGPRERMVRRSGISVGAPEVTRQKGVAVVQVDGVLTRRPDFWQIFFDGVSTEQLAKTIEELGNDDDTKAIVMRVDSPGGEASGMPELARAVRSAAAKKPVIVLNEGALFSGSYYFACEATAIYSTGENYRVGSIGTIVVLYDYSKMYEQRGVEPVVIATGSLKGAGVPGSRVTEEQREYVRGIVEAVQKKFEETVARGRSLTEKQIAEVSTGATFSNDDALRLHLIDGVQSYETTMAQLSPPSKKDKSQMSQENNQDQPATLDQLKALPGATSDFIVSAMDRKLDIGMATLELMKQQQETITKSQQEAKDATDKLAQSEAERKELDAKLSGKNVERSTDDEQLGEGGKQSGGGSGFDGDAVKQWKQRQKELCAEGMDLADATRQLIHDEPELHEAYKQAVAENYVPASEQMRRMAIS